MARANRHFLPNQVWHITHRCHQKDFLLKFSKDRQGAYWEDRYHATAIESNNHLHRCITYIDLNMVRAGVVLNILNIGHRVATQKYKIHHVVTQ